MMKRYIIGQRVATDADIWPHTRGLFVIYAAADEDKRPIMHLANDIMLVAY